MLVKWVREQTWTAFFAAAQSGEYQTAFSELQALWEQAWQRFQNIPGKAAPADCQILATVVVCKACISFKCQMYDAAFDETSLALKLLEWKDTDSLWSQLSSYLMTLESAWDTRGLFHPTIRHSVFDVPFILFAVITNLAIEVLVSQRRIEAAIDRLLLMRHFLLCYADLVDYKERRVPPGAGWGTQRPAVEAECALFRAVELLVQTGQPETAWTLVNDPLSEMHTTHTAALDVLKLKIALITLRHEEAVRILHQSTTQVNSPMCATVARAFLCQGCETVGAQENFRQSLEMLQNPTNHPGVELVRHCLSNNLAVARIHRKDFLGAFVTLYERLSEFLPIGVTGDQSNPRRLPGVERVAASPSPAPFVPLFLTFRNAITLNEFIAQTIPGNQTLRELVRARGIIDRTVLHKGLNEKDITR